MIKYLFFIMFICLSGCNLFGWDSSGGNNGDITSPVDGTTKMQRFFISAPANYPLNGSALIINTDEGDVIVVEDTDVTSVSDLNDISSADSLKIVQASCDETATSISNIEIATDANIEWINEASQTAELILYNATQGTDSIRLIECLAF